MYRQDFKWRWDEDRSGEVSRFTSVSRWQREFQSVLPDYFSAKLRRHVCFGGHETGREGVSLSPTGYSHLHLLPQFENINIYLIFVVAPYLSVQASSLVSQGDRGRLELIGQNTYTEKDTLDSKVASIK